LFGRQQRRCATGRRDDGYPAPVELTFDNVTNSGETTVTSGTVGQGGNPPAPGRFRLGSPPMYFLVTRIDGAVAGGGSTDRFRKLWTIATGAIVYDDRMGQIEDSDSATQLGGGSIVIHK
jgi:hypothetical protein